MELDFGNLLGILGVALIAPLIVNVVPQLRVPSVALEIVLGIVVGPAVLGWVESDVAVEVVSTVGLGYLLFLAGLEIDLPAIRTRTRQLTLGFGLSAVLALVFGAAIGFGDVNDEPLFIAVVLLSTSLSLVAPILKEIGETDTDFGQTLLASASTGEFGALLLLSVFFNADEHGPGTEVVLFVIFALLAMLLTFVLARVGNSLKALDLLERLGDTPAQLGVRFVLVVLALFTAMASRLGFEAILGSFAAGLLLRLTDRSNKLESEQFKAKLDAIGYGFLVPVFFVTSGVDFDIDALFGSSSHLVLVPILLGGMLFVRGLPAVLLRAEYGPRRAAGAGFLQAINLSIIVIAAQLGPELGVIDDSTSAALLAAGILSVVIYPPIALALFGREQALTAVIRDEDL